jgi:2-methylisocitrate lyase-like PEP mutase family enzyme
VQEHLARRDAGGRGDQGFPEKCCPLDNKTIVTLCDYLAKISAAVAACQDPGFDIIARTDSRAVPGFEEAIRRANAALPAGGAPDVAFVEATGTALEALPFQSSSRGHAF